MRSAVSIRSSRFANIALAVLLAAGSAVLLALPASPRLINGGDARKVRARVVSVDDSGLARHGFMEFGTQRLKVELADGRIMRADNEIRAQLELDKKFVPGDVALVVLPENAGDDDILITSDHWRLGWAAAIFLAFAVLLCIFGGWSGARALFTFFFSCLAIWKFLVPAALSGHDARIVCFACVAILSAVIVFSIAGISRTGAAAFAGSLLGVSTSLVLADVFAAAMHINGATMPFVQQLLYSGAPKLDMADIFCGAAILAASGAVMDLAMDVASGVAEVARHNPSLGFRELFASGLNIGRAVVGTMATTLLLAYSGGYLTLLMVFAATGTAPADFLNSTLISAEFVKTFVGSFALVLVAPFTSAVSAAVLRK